MSLEEDLLDHVYANDNEEVKELLESGVDPNFQSFDEDDGGFSPLMWATLNGNETLLRLLLFYGANPFLENNEGQTAMDLLDPDSQFDGGIRKRFLFRKILEESMQDYMIAMGKERRQEELVRSTQRSSFMRGMYDDDSPISNIDDPEVFRTISSYLPSMGQKVFEDPKLHRRDRKLRDLRLRMLIDAFEIHREKEREEKENQLITDYLDSIEQYGGMYRFKR